MPSTEQWQQSAVKRPARAAWPLTLAGLSFAGAGISGYLWLAKVGTASLVCGPIGDCAFVNASAFSELFGIPIAALGTILYLILALILVYHWWRPAPSLLTSGFTLALAGALFSLYLTAVEAFVLRAYCVWCLTSWILVTIITWRWAVALRRSKNALAFSTE